MKSLWEALELVKKSGVSSATLRYVSADGTVVDAVVPIESLKEESFDVGIKLENGAVVYPNASSAILNPFLEVPAISFVCELEKRSLDPVRVAPSAVQNSLSSPVPSIFPLTVAGRPVKEMAPGVGDSEPSKTQADAFANHRRMQMQRIQLQQQMQQQQQPDSQGGSVIMSTLSGGSTAGSESHRGTSCHQCKNARPMTQLAFCSTLFNKRTSSDMRNCRKKFCQGCLTKFYGDAIENSHKQGWICPSCRGICRCAACGRKRRKNKDVIGAAFQQVAGAQLGAVLEQQMRSLSSLVLPDVHVIPDCHDYTSSNPEALKAQVSEDPASEEIAEAKLTGGSAVAAEEKEPNKSVEAKAEGHGLEENEKMKDEEPDAKEDAESEGQEMQEDDVDDEKERRSSDMKEQPARVSRRGRKHPYEAPASAAHKRALRSSK